MYDWLKFPIRNIIEYLLGLPLKCIIDSTNIHTNAAEP
jgi:hypothetical protein